MLVDRCGECPACKRIEDQKPAMLACANPPFSHVSDGIVQVWNQLLDDNPCERWSEEEKLYVHYQAMRVSESIRPRRRRAHLCLTIDLVYDLEDVTVEELRENLERLVQHASGDGWFTGETAATIRHWTSGVREIPDDVPYVQALASVLDTQAEDFDDLVHDVASKHASAVNNGGIYEQIEFLVEQLGVEEVEQALLRDARDRKREADNHTCSHCGEREADNPIKAPDPYLHVRIPQQAIIDAASQERPLEVQVKLDDEGVVVDVMTADLGATGHVTDASTRKLYPELGVAVRRIDFDCGGLDDICANWTNGNLTDVINILMASHPCVTAMVLVQGRRQGLLDKDDLTVITNMLLDRKHAENEHLE